MNNRKIEKKFIDALYEMQVKRKLTLKDCFEIMKESENRCLKRIAKELSKHLEKGESFSNCLMQNPCFDFDTLTIAFISLAEKTGDLISSLDFLQKRCERKEKDSQVFLSAIVYPLFVVFFSFVLCLMFLFFGDELLCGQNFNRGDFVRKIFFLYAGLFVFDFICFFALKEILGTNKIYEVFSAVDFLINSGISLNFAIRYGTLILNPGEKLWKYFKNVGLKIEQGENLEKAFSNGWGYWGKIIKETFFYASRLENGTEEYVFQQICKSLDEEKHKRRQVILSLIEPFFVGITGIFLFLLIVNILMPVMSQTANFI